MQASPISSPRRPFHFNPSVLLSVICFLRRNIAALKTAAFYPLKGRPPSLPFSFPPTCSISLLGRPQTHASTIISSSSPIHLHHHIITIYHHPIFHHHPTSTELTIQHQRSLESLGVDHPSTPASAVLAASPRVPPSTEASPHVHRSTSLEAPKEIQPALWPILARSGLRLASQVQSLLAAVAPLSPWTHLLVNPLGRVHVESLWSLDREMERRVVIIGAGISGLLACKYSVEKGFDPVVFEAEDRIGGVWNRTIQSTKLQNVKDGFRFSDFDWPASVQEIFPSHTEVLDYVESYARHFNLYPYIKFHSRVINVDFVGESFEEMKTWDLWGGTGMAFGSKGKWHITVLDTETNATEVHQAEFVILCIGRFSGLPNIPELPPTYCSKVFDGKVMHSMEYSDMEKSAAAELIKGKRITIVGSQKSAVDLAVECAEANGVKYPCVMIQRNPHWLLPGNGFLISHVGHLYFNRFAELCLHKPGQNVLYWLLATVLSPLRWGISKFSEIYLQWKLPLKKYGVVPRHSFLEDMSSCQIGMLPDNFYDKVEEGSILIKRSQSFRFCREGLIVGGEDKPISSDLVILATGYKGDQKLKNIFRSSVFQKYLVPSPTSTIPLYRQVIHPWIPQLAIIGYAEGFANLPSFEIRCQWLTHLLDGNIKLPSIGAMEKDTARWESHMKRYGRRNFRRSCVLTTNIWYNDQLCKDMNCNPRRKKGFLAEWFQPYGPADYAGLTDQKR